VLHSSQMKEFAMLTVGPSVSQESAKMLFVLFPNAMDPTVAASITAVKTVFASRLQAVLVFVVLELHVLLFPTAILMQTVLWELFVQLALAVAGMFVWGHKVVRMA
jgi:hypothetical protein